jgi:hypothetical protein
MFMGVIPMVFYLGINLVALLLEMAFIFVGRPFSK